MPFPFMPIGIMTGAVVLGAAFALAYALVMQLDRAFSEVGGAVVGRLVSGFDDWSHERSRPGPASDTGRRGELETALARSDPTAPAPAYEDAAGVPVEPARPDRR
jgi:hypothetical protein